MLLEETLTVDSLRHADHGQGPVGEVRQHEAAHARQITQEIALGGRLRPRSARGWPVDAVEIAEGDARTANLELQGLGRILELLQHLGDEWSVAVRSATLRRSARGGAAVAAPPYALRIDVIP